MNTDFIDIYKFIYSSFNTMNAAIATLVYYKRLMVVNTS